MTILVITAVDAEAEAIGAPASTRVIAGGIGRTNAAAATTEAIVLGRDVRAVISAGVAGALPVAGAPALGETVVATRCVYAEEGLITPGGFGDMSALGFRLGDFEGNAVPVNGRLLKRLAGGAAAFRAGPIATVATCSGTAAAASEVARRTGAIAEAMEGAAVVHAARRLGVPAIELRAISNTTGDRDQQCWDLPGALVALGAAVRRAVELVAAAVDD